MATTTARVAGGFDRTFLRPLGALATAALLALCGLTIAVQVPSPSPLFAFAAISGLAVVAWMLLSERYAWSLAVLMLYLGLLDGYLKLRTGSSNMTLVRDLLLYAIVAGALLRAAVRHRPLQLPPLAGWVIAWVAVVAIQIANPENGTLQHSISSVRPHVEFVPLFFLAYFVIRSQARLRAFLVLLLTVAAVNGVVGLVQTNLTPEQFSAWGPGYERALTDENNVAPRTFADEEGEVHNRPFALGGDFGFGGTVGMLAIPAALALLAISGGGPFRLLVLLLLAGAALGVLTSGARVAVIGSVVAVLAYAGLTVTSRAGLRTVVAVAVAALVGYGTVTYFAANGKEGSLDRYGSIDSPSKAISTAYDYRRETLEQIPVYIREIPLGAGIGSKGPAASRGGDGGAGLNGESEPTFLLIELGIPGLVVMLGFNLALFYLAVTRIRRIADRETRVLLTAIAAPLFALFATWFAGIGTASVPGAPYLWFAAGVLAFWLANPNMWQRWSSA